MVWRLMRCLHEFDPAPCWTDRAVIGRCKRSLKKYGGPEIGRLTYLYDSKLAPVRRPARFAVVEPRRHVNAPYSWITAWACARFGKTGIGLVQRRLRAARATTVAVLSRLALVTQTTFDILASS
jgi:hypothetical protein